MIVKEVEFEVVPKTNLSMIKSAEKHRNREKFFAELDNMPFDEAVKKFANPKVTIKSLSVMILKKMGLFETVKKMYRKVLQFH